ncbi:hypothetical protein I4U23_005659 [Adineta vaga]|nr:hypothetical protein I4U23_005659 [Adineta vaga]
MTALTILNDGHNHAHGQAILERALHLYSLSLPQYASSREVVTLEYTSPSIYRLELMEKEHFSDAQECFMLSHSPLGIQCQILLIKVADRTDVIDLLNTMTNLRKLTVICEHDTWKDADDLWLLSCSSDNEQPSLSEVDEFLDWFKHRLPSTYTIIRAPKKFNYDLTFDGFHPIQFWIDSKMSP